MAAHDQLLGTKPQTYGTQFVEPLTINDEARLATSRNAHRRNEDICMGAIMREGLTLINKCNHPSISEARDATKLVASSILRLICAAWHGNNCLGSRASIAISAQPLFGHE